jgi:hypothetical protein
MRRLLIVASVCVLWPAGIALASVSGTFKGKTSVGAKVLIEIRGRKVKSASYINYWLACSSGAAVLGQEFFGGGLSSDDSFSIVNIHTSDRVDGGKYTVHHTVTIKFRVAANSARGTFRDSATVVARSGRTVDHCKSGTLTFRASK